MEITLKAKIFHIDGTIIVVLVVMLSYYTYSLQFRTVYLLRKDKPRFLHNNPIFYILSAMMAGGGTPIPYRQAHAESLCIQISEQN